MGKSDIAVNTYLEDASRFADVVNHGLFDGKTVIRPEQLAEADTVANGYSGTKKNRDIVKKVFDGKVLISIIGIETQKNVHYAMPLKNLHYDLNNYEKQRLEIAREHKRAKDLKGDEWLSRFARTDKLIPTVTLVVYCGARPWEGPRSLHDMMSISDGMKPYQSLFTDCPVHLLAVNEIQSLETYSDDLKIVFGFIKYQERMEELLQYVQENEKLFQAVSKENCHVITEMTNSGEIEKYLEKDQEVVNMCQALHDLKNEGIVIGKNEGIVIGKNEGIYIGKISMIDQMVEKLNQKLSVACDMAGITVEKYYEVKKQIS